MAKYLPLTIEPRGDREILMSRDFNAPRELVWDAWTKPELVRQWLYGPDGWTMSRCEIDLRVGGAYRFELTQVDTSMPKGELPSGETFVTMGWGGIFTEINHPERFVNTEQFDESWYEGESVITNILTDLGGGMTRFDSILAYVSTEARDSVLASDMESGVAMGYDRLQDLMESILAGAATPA